MNEQDIINELNNIGIRIKSIYDLVNTNSSYSMAIPILINALKTGIDNDKTKEGVIRALTVKDARGIAGKALLEEFNNINDLKKHLLWIIGNAMNIVITEEEVDPILKIIRNKKYGKSRQMFVLSLGNVKRSNKVEDHLISSLDDEEIASHAIAALSKLKSVKATDKIRSLAMNSNKLIRSEALKALKKIEKNSVLKKTES